jgi:hypothetical protein
MTTSVRTAPDDFALETLVPFIDCDPTEVARVRELSRQIHAAAGDRVITAGERGERLYVVMSGAVRVRNADGLDHQLGRGDVVGELAMLGGEPSSADVIAVVDTDLLAIEASAIPELLEIAPVAARLRAIGRARLAAPAAVAVEAAIVPVIRPRPVVRGVGAGIHSRTEVPARPVRAVLLIGLVVVLGLVGAWVMTQRNAATVVDLDEVLADARSDDPVATAPTTPVVSPQAGSGPAADPASGATDSDPVAPEAQPTPGTAEVDAATYDQVGDQPVVDPAPPADAPQSSPRFRLPAAGVYSYATTGGDRINVAGASHRYPEVTHAILRHTGGCGWSVEHRVLEEHVDLHDRCSATDAVSVVADGRDVEFFGQRDGLMYHCNPPARTLWDTPVGTVSTGTCATADGDSDADYVGTFIGLETLDVGGAPVETAHVHLEFEMTGSARGTSTVDFWLHPETGLIVREERVVDTYARAVWGDVRYQEEATFHLLSLTPQT